MAISANIAVSLGRRRNRVKEDRGSRIEDRGSKIENRESRIEDRLSLEDAIFTPRSSIFDPRSSSLDKPGNRRGQSPPGIDFQNESHPPRVAAVRQALRSRNQHPIWKAPRSFARRLYKSF